MKMKTLLVIAGLAIASTAQNAVAEVHEVTIAKEYGIGYLPYMIMEHEHMIEKQAKARGLGDIKVNWKTFGGSNVMQSALIAGKVDFASSGSPHFIILWAKTHGAIKSAGALDALPLFLNTRNPKIHSIRDFTEKDRIALPTVKSSSQAIFLQMAAARTWGPKNAFKLDNLTVSLSHPEGTTALLSGISEIDSHFTSPPFQEVELKDPRIHKVTDSYAIVGGPITFNVTCVPVKFTQENPKTYAAYVAALEEAQAFINQHHDKAADIYLAMSGDKRLTRADLLKLFNNRNYQFSTTPLNFMKYVNFLYSIGTIKTKPASWKDMFFPNMHNRHGS